MTLDADGMEYWTPVVAEEYKPHLGLSFPSIEAAFLFYEMYASLGGFEIRRASEKHHRDGTVTLKYFYCSKQGYSEVVGFNSLESEGGKKQKRNRPTTRSGCLAKMNIKFDANRLYFVCKFVEEHNHCLAEPDGIQFLKSSRKLNVLHQSFIGQLADMNVGPSLAHRIFAQLVGGFEKVRATLNDFKNFRRDYRIFIGPEDADMAVRLNMEKVNNGSGFSFEYYKDEGGHLCRLFWADQTGKVNYALFGDVVSFDATYRTNK